MILAENGYYNSKTKGDTDLGAISNIRGVIFTGKKSSLEEKFSSWPNSQLRLSKAVYARISKPA